MKLVDCTRCPLHKTRIQVVKGSGSRNAKIFFIGEAPGEHEDIEGVPFVGYAGKILNEELTDNGIDRKDVYITNTVKCRPPKNREPNISEKHACNVWLKKELEIIMPDYIITLGAHAYRTIDEMLSPVRIGDGVYEVSFNKKKMVVHKMFHPAAVLYNPALWKPFRVGFKLLIDKIKARPA